MLYYPQGFTKPLRVQGAFVTDDEVAKVVDFLSKHNEAGTYSEEIQEKIASAEIGTDPEATGTMLPPTAATPISRRLQTADREGKGIDRHAAAKLKVGFNRAARIMDQLQEPASSARRREPSPERYS